MRVVTASTYGGPEVLRVEERPAPQPQADDVLVEVKAAGVNLMDIYARRGMLGMFPATSRCRRRDSNPRHADYDSALGPTAGFGCFAFALEIGAFQQFRRV